MNIFVLLYNSGTDREGIHSIELKGRTIVLMFEDKDDATRYCGLLEAQDFPLPTVEMIDVEEIKDFCIKLDYEFKLVEKNFVPKTAEDRLLISPPQKNLEVEDWEGDKNKNIDSTIFYSYGKHDTLNLQEDFLTHILQGSDVGIISEAGVPCVADPGSKIVKFAHQYQIEVSPIPGPSSILLALIASGFNGQNFAFNGYLPIDKKERSKKIKELEIYSKKKGQTQIFMETPYRNLQLFESIVKTCSNRTKLCIASDITLDSENIKTRTIEEWSSIRPEIHKKPSIFLISQ